ncbi:hypothetical protein JDV02_000365 [Purpureocillium takamizusanense]|uniref:Glycosyl transferase CAP10 domain-containing protein n=1 Tax=Purpureocillium takamizusanense TaxID=2060973 RepID=A0A9Q8V6S6_9HYPO|nr:uncharacterized protein JDV02_000365 [Purpureocillium takamizusanense]UNI13641.1 hypothetical protein JDV02_000365 [Purpureocillium takamizusanense]
MIAIGQRPVSVAWTLCGAVLSCYILSNKYYTSIALERPLHFSVLTFLIVGFVVKRHAAGRRQLDKPLVPTIIHRQYQRRSPRRRALSFLRSRIQDIRVLPTSLQLLLGCIVSRTALFWYTIRTTQCSCPGIEAFLPIFAHMCVTVLQYDDSSTSAEAAEARQQATTPGRSRPLSPILSYVLSSFSSLVWALGSVVALSKARVLTGTVCSSELATFYAQLGMCALDAVILTLVARLHGRRSHDDEAEADDGHVANHLATVFLFAGLCGIALAVPSWLTDAGFLLAFKIGPGDLGRLVLDSTVAALGVLCGVAMLRDFSPTAVALLVSEVGLFGFLVPRFRFATPLSPDAETQVGQSALLAAVSAALLWRVLAVPTSHSPQQYAAAATGLRWLLACHVGAVVLTVLCATLAPARPSTTDQPLLLFEAVEQLAASATTAKEAWQRQAAASKSLSSAAAEYRRRYGMAPPPNFDKWYEFAMRAESPVIDDFDQIYRDVLPFWGVEPAVLRERTAHLLEHPTLEMGGMRIQGGRVYQSPHIPGTHRWMAEALERMIEPFATWLPDMVLAVNLADECRVAVPFEEMQLLKHRARATTSRLTAGKYTERLQQQSYDDTTPDKSPVREWASDFPLPTTRHTRPGSLTSPYFTNNIRKQIFYDWLAATCPPRSPARTTHWWDWSTLCTGCLSPHSLPVTIVAASSPPPGTSSSTSSSATNNNNDNAAAAATPLSGFILSNATLARDPCHQPDLAYLDGFTLSPAAMIGTRTLFPVFSQARVGGFADLLIPSPWDFADKSAYDADADRPWEEKENGLYWRGTGSDGFAAHGAWAGFLRARFAHEAYEQQQRHVPSTDLRINVSFVGDVSKCDAGDCAAELDAFSLWGTTVVPSNHSSSSSSSLKEKKKKEKKLPPPLPFEENWRFRHLMDMDGAGFSGRFRSFLQSRSLPYRAALFQAWYDERVFSWHDYVPADVRLGDGFWGVVRYLAGVGGGEDNKEEEEVEGDDDDDDIVVARRQGPQTAQKIALQGREWAAKALRKEDMQVYLFRLLLEWGRVVSDDRETMMYDDDSGDDWTRP